MRRYQPKEVHSTMIKNGATLRLFHKECEAYLCVEGLFNWNLVQDGEPKCFSIQAGQKAHEIHF